MCIWFNAMANWWSIVLVDPRSWDQIPAIKHTFLLLSRSVLQVERGSKRVSEIWMEIVS